MTKDAFNLGANYFIMKPFRKEVIIDKIFADRISENLIDCLHLASVPGYLYRMTNCSLHTTRGSLTFFGNIRV